MKHTVHAVLAMATVALATLIVSSVIQYKMDSIDKVKQSHAGITMAELDRQLKCMADNIYWEAASEPVEGKIAVAQVVMNRVAHPDFPKTVCGVVQQKSIIANRLVCQFSWLCENTYKTRPKYAPLYNESMEVAKKVYLEKFRLPSLRGALYYHADYVSPQWQFHKVAKIGRHIFYEPKGRA
jgi:spore germination cell wall hydrolase CwlJ-like protein